MTAQLRSPGRDGGISRSETPGSGSTSDGKPYSGDTIAIGGTATGTFAAKDVGTSLAVTVTGVTVSGTRAAITA